MILLLLIIVIITIIITIIIIIIIIIIMAKKTLLLQKHLSTLLWPLLWPILISVKYQGAFLPYFSSWVLVINLYNAASDLHLKIGKRSYLTISVKLKWNGARKNSFAKSRTWNNTLSSFAGRDCGVSPSSTRWLASCTPKHMTIIRIACHTVVPSYINSA